MLEVFLGSGLGVMERQILRLFCFTNLLGAFLNPHCSMFLNKVFSHCQGHYTILMKNDSLHVCEKLRNLVCQILNQLKKPQVIFV